MPAKKMVDPKQRYLISAEEPAHLDELVDLIDGDPRLELLDHIGPAGQPHTLVIAMKEEEAAALQRRFAGRLSVEPDGPVAQQSDAPHNAGKKNQNPQNPSAGPAGAATVQTVEDDEREDRIEMADKNEQTTSTQSSSSQSGSGRSGSPSGTAAATGAARSGSGGIAPPGKVVAAKEKQFLIAPRRMAGFMQSMGPQTMGLDYIEQALRGTPDVEIVDRIGPKGLVGTLADGMGGIPHILIAKMAEDKAEVLRQQSAGQLIVEPDQPLHLNLSETGEPSLVAGVVATGGHVVSVSVMVLGRDNTPVRDAEVHLFSEVTQASSITDERGVATISVSSDAAQSVTGLYIKPKSDYWTFYQTQPALDTSQTNLVYVRSLSDTFQGFPRQQVLGWGQKVMRLDQIPGSYRGQGTRVAIVDSGASTKHPDLQGIKFGFDILNKKSELNGWNQDPVAHGSHCAGIIAGADNGTGIRGFAPDSEVHICKQFPGGQISQLIEALEYCIEKQIDLVNLSLSGAQPSEALEQQILRAKRLGVACIAAAGNSAGHVQYPASSPNVLAVSAIGRIGEFPADSYHAHTVGAMDHTGFFSPRFTCFGPEISVCAPGVAILSSVPPNNYAVWDGTSMAASHVTGLAALVLAHHPDFQGPFKARTSDRVDRLFQILRASAQPVNAGDPRRTGFGIPDALVALGLAPQAHLYSNRGLFAGALFGNYPQFGQFGGLGFGQATGFAQGPSYQPSNVPVGAW